MRLRRAMLFVKDLDRMADFYGRHLGLKAVDGTRTASWVEFHSGLALHAVPPDIAAEIELDTPPRPRRDNPIKLIFEVEDLASERKRLEALGVSLLPQPWGACDGIDPEGNIFQLCAMAEDPDGPL